MPDIRDNVFTTSKLRPGESLSSDIQSADDIDTVAVTLEAGREYVFTARGQSSGGGTLPDPDLSIYNDVLELLAEDYNSGTGTDARLTFTPSASGTYYLNVSGFGGTGTYTLRAVIGSSFSGDVSASMGTTSAMTVGSSKTGTIDYNGDQDWHGVPLTAGQTYQMQMTGSSGGGGTLPDPVLHVYDPYGALLAINDDDASSLDSLVTFTAAYTGTYYLSAGSFAADGGTWTGSYTVSVATAPVADLDEFTLFVLSPIGHFTSDVEVADDFDIIRMDLASNEYYLVDLIALSGNLDPVLSLYDSGGNFVTSNDDFNGLDSQLTITVPTSGTYFLVAEGFGGSTGSYVLSSALLGLEYNGLSTADYVEGSSALDLLSGNGGNDTLLGGPAADTLIGGSGADTMSGGTGDDVFFVDDAGDTIVENSLEGNDRVVASVSYTLGYLSYVETLETVSYTGTGTIDLTGSGTANLILGNNGVNRLDGGEGDDALHGFAGNDYLVGGNGIDNLYGGAGDDAYFIGSFGPDRIWELAGEGYDTVSTNVDYTLPDTAHVERLEAGSIVGTAALSLGGSMLDNLIVGNAGDNRLRGFAGNDTLQGLGGNDVLIGDEGADVMYGGTGSDTYYVNTSDDRIFEVSGEGYDRVATEVSFTLPNEAEVELLEAVNLTGTAIGELGGSLFANTIVGDAGNNLLRGYGGADTLVGSLGNDTLLGDEGSDTLHGGAGDDVYFVDAAGDLVVETDGQGSDRVASSVSYVLSAAAEIETLETASLASTEALSLTGSNSNNLVIGNNGANWLDGGAGNDVLIGYGGADNFAFTTGLGSGNVDRIEDFASGTDKIALDDAVFAAIAPGALAANAFYTGEHAVDADDRIIYNPATGALYYDADGTGAGTQVQFATLTIGTALNGADFLLI